MEDLIYKFLMQSGFSRASIVTDVKTVDSSASYDDATYVIVDPQTVDRLAVLKVVGPVNADTLIDQSALVARFTQSVGGTQAQGYVVRVDAKASREAEQVQFYRCYPNTDLQQVTARAFPDLDSLKVNFKLTAKKSPIEPQSVQLPEDDLIEEIRLSPSAYIWGALLVLLGLVDWIARTFFATVLLEPAQALLIISGVLLLTAPSLVRYVAAVIRYD